MRPGYLIVGVLLAACSRKQQVEPQLPLHALRVVLASEAELAKLGTAGDGIVRRPWVGPIVQTLAVETPDALTPLQHARIAGSGMTADALFERGLANLRAACKQPLQERTVAMAKAQVQITRSADNFTAARLQLPELWKKIASDAGQLYAAAPARDILVWTTSIVRADQLALRGQARTAFQSRSDPISSAILRWTGDGWALDDPNPIP